MKKGWLLFIVWLLLLMGTTPVLADDPTSDNSSEVGVDPVTGRNQGFDLMWEDIYLATVYEVQLAKDPNFTLIVFETQSYTPPNIMNPALIFAPGQLEAGHVYYWRVRVRGVATGESILSPWSEPVKFTVKAGLATATPYLSPIALSPTNGALDMPPTPVAFSWTAMVDVTQYQFQLAEDASMSELIVDVVVPTTAHNYEGPLNYGTSYYWRVRATQPSLSDFSPVFSFTTVAPPQLQPPSPQVASTLPLIPLWVWVIASIGTSLVGMIAFLIVRGIKLRK